MYEIDGLDLIFIYEIHGLFPERPRICSSYMKLFSMGLISPDMCLFVCELQCVAVCCSVLQCVALCCSALQCVAMCCSTISKAIRFMALWEKECVFSDLQSVIPRSSDCHRCVFSKVSFIRVCDS